MKSVKLGGIYQQVKDIRATNVEEIYVSLFFTFNTFVSLCSYAKNMLTFFYLTLRFKNQD